MGRLPSLNRLSFDVLQSELRRRSRSVRKLERRRDALAARIEQLDEQIRRMGGSVSGNATGRRGGGGARPKNEMTLVEALSKALKSKTMGVSEVADAVQEAGYRTNSNNFRTQVNIALSKGPFKRVERGQYTAK
jgi:hypothetical protein